MSDRNEPPEGYVIEDDWCGHPMPCLANYEPKYPTRESSIAACWVHHDEIEARGRARERARAARLAKALDSVFIWLRTWAIERPYLPVTLEVIEEWKDRIVLVGDKAGVRDV